ncbi:MAG: biotin synthase BioB [Candidatus Omnitrophota bacterium]
MDASTARDILSLPLEELLSIANRSRREGVGRNIEICSVINAKSGACSEDCKFCAQSAHYFTDIQNHSLKTKDEMIASARAAKANGADRFGVVTSGRTLAACEIKIIAEAIRAIREEVGIVPCASLGALSEESFAVLKDAGLSRYHHNIETSQRFYPQIVSTHDYGERVSTIRSAKKMGLEVCAGGVLGMGETWQDRIDMALLLKELAVDSVPLNFLVPIKGTPLEGAKKISPIEAIRAIALFRIILKGATIKVVAGRESVLKDFQGFMYRAGANGMMIGGYLTIAGRSPEEDRALVAEVQKIWNEE